MKKNIVFLLILILIIWISCDGMGHQTIDFRKIENLMPQHPDSALMLLEQIENKENLSRKDKAHYYLLLTEAQDKTFVKHETDSLITIATDYYEETAPDEQRTFLEKRFFSDMLATLLARENLGILSPYLSPSKASSKILSALKEKPIILEPIFNFIFGAGWELTRGDWVIPNKQLFCYRPVIFKLTSLAISNFIQEKKFTPFRILRHFDSSAPRVYGASKRIRYPFL